MINVIKYLKRENYKFITISDGKKLEKWGVCECNIVVPITMASFFDSFVYTFCVLNILIDEVGRIDENNTKQQLDKLETMYRNEELFYVKEK